MNCTRKAFHLTMVAAALFLLAAGCSGSPGEYTVDPEGPLPLNPGDLPFPAEEAAQYWDLDEARTLIEWVDGGVRAYYLYDGAAGELNIIVGIAENALFECINGKNLLFIARGGDETGNFDFPYSLCYQLTTGEITREKLRLPINTPTAFGKGTRQVLQDLYFEGPYVVFEFAPDPETIMAGGSSFPMTTIRQHGAADTLILRFYSVSAANIPERVEPAAGNGPYGLVSVRERPVNDFLEEDRLLLQSGFPYGLLLPQDRVFEGTGVEVKIDLSGAGTYTIETVYAEKDGKSIIRYYLKYLTRV